MHALRVCGARLGAGLVTAFTLGAAGLAVGVSGGWMADDPIAGLPEVPVPPENPITEEKRVLGKILFWDEQLSSDGTMACGTCHVPRAGGTDRRRGVHPGPDGVPGTGDDRLASPGVVHADGGDEYEPAPPFGLRVQVTDRQANPAVMAMYAPDLFWDGRATSEFVDPETGEVAIVEGGALESQAVGPPVSAVEMAHESYRWAELRSRLSAARPLALAEDLPADVAAALAGDPTYPELFEAAFGDDDITARRIAFAIATYERTLVPDQTPLDRYLDGETDAITPDQQEGWFSFLGSACAHCHPFPEFTDNGFRNIGVRPIGEDRGRENVTGDPADRGKFKVPTLRNVGIRDRFMHNGMHLSMGQVMDFYAHRNGEGPVGNNIDPLFDGPIEFDPAVEARIVDFMMNALTDPRVAGAEFPFDRPTLRTDLPPNPERVGGGSAGSGGIVPVIIANRPPYLGNRWFQVGLDRALGDATAWVAVSADPPQDGRLEADEVLGPFVVSGSGAGAGYATAPYPIAQDPSLDGDVFYMQWVVNDPGGQDGEARSEVVRVTRFCGNGACLCPSDFSRDGVVNTIDVIAFLNEWSAGDLKADMNRDGVVNTIDVIEFLNAWSAGC